MSKANDVESTRAIEVRYSVVEGKKNLPVENAIEVSSNIHLSYEKEWLIFKLPFYVDGELFSVLTKVLSAGIMGLTLSTSPRHSLTLVRPTVHSNKSFFIVLRLV